MLEPDVHAQIAILSEKENKSGFSNSLNICQEPCGLIVLVTPSFSLSSIN